MDIRGTLSNPTQEGRRAPTHRLRVQAVAMHVHDTPAPPGIIRSEHIAIVGGVDDARFAWMNERSGSRLRRWPAGGHPSIGRIRPSRYAATSRARQEAKVLRE